MKSSILTPLILLEIIFCALFAFVFGLEILLLFFCVSAFFGFMLLALFWRNLLSFRLQNFKDLLNNFAFVFAGILFLIPGVLSSFCALLILIFAKFFKAKKPKKDEEFIDVEIIER